MAIYTRTGDTGETSLFGGQRTNKGSLQMSVIGAVDELNSQLGLAVAMMESTRSARQNLTNPDLTVKIDIGLAKLVGQLRDVQRELFEMGAELARGGMDNPSKMPRMAESFLNEAKTQAVPGRLSENSGIGKDQNLNATIKLFDAAKLEQMIDEMEADLPRLQNFILPGGGVIGAQLMITRAVCRRAEREFIRFVNSKFKITNYKQIHHQSTKHSHNEMIMAYLNRLSDYLFVASRWVNWVMGEEEMVWRRS